MPAPKVFIDRDRIDETVGRLATEVAKAYPEGVFCVVVLDGAMIFATHFMDALSKKGVKVAYSTIRISTYEGGESSGNLTIHHDIGEDVKGRDVLIVEDIVDTGFTMAFLRDHVAKRGARSVKVCTLLDKPSRRTTDVRLDFVGMTIEDRFVVGYGMDYEGRYRLLPYVGIIEVP